MARIPSPESYAKNLVAIYKGDTNRAAEAVTSTRNVTEEYWASVLACIKAKAAETFKGVK